MSNLRLGTLMNHTHLGFVVFGEVEGARPVAKSIRNIPPSIFVGVKAFGKL